MIANLPERVSKRQKKPSKALYRSKYLFQSTSRGVKTRTQSQVPLTGESIPMGMQLPKEYTLSAEFASGRVTGSEAFVTHLPLLPVGSDPFTRIAVKSPTQQLALKVHSISLNNVWLQQSNVMSTWRSISSQAMNNWRDKWISPSSVIDIASHFEQKAKEQQAAFNWVVKRLYAESHQKLIATIKSSIEASFLKANELRAVSLQDDDAKSFSNLLSDLKVGGETPSDDAVDAVLEIQCLPIPELLKNEAIIALVDFIKKHRATNSQKVLIAVGAAIRKVLLNLSSTEIGFAAELLKVEGNLTVPIDVELEVAKMVVQRVVENPSINALQFPELADAMLDNAKSYSTPKMVNREFYNATALNSVLACVLLRSPESQSLSNQVLNDSPSWFSRLCSNRLKRIRAGLLSRSDSNSQELAKHLSSLALLADGDQKSQEGTVS